MVARVEVMSCLIDPEFQFGRMKELRRWDDGDGCTTM